MRSDPKGHYYNNANFAVGDVGGNDNLEIVTPYEIYNADGSNYCSAPYTYANSNGGNDDSNLVVLGDLTGNSKNEIVYLGVNKLHVWDGGGNYLPGWEGGKDIHGIDGHYYERLRIAEPILGDLDGDGDLEIVACSNDRTRLYAFNHDGTTVGGWPADGKVLDAKAAVGLQSDSLHPADTAGGPVMGDIDGDGDQEIVYLIMGGCGNPGHATQSTLYAFHHDGSEYTDDDFPRVIPGVNPYVAFFGAVPLLNDLDKDGDIEIVVQTTANLHIFDLPGVYNPANIEWGRWRYDERNTACYEEVPEPSSVFLMVLGLGLMGLFSFYKKSSRSQR